MNSISSLPNVNPVSMSPNENSVSNGQTALSKEAQEKNIQSMIQARYGAKPREAREVKKSLDKDDFMRIMMTELKHQDPTKPMEAEKMAAQMAQLTTVEQLKNMGTAMERMADKNAATDRLAMSGMIGQKVTVDRSRFTHSKGITSPVQYDLPEYAQKVKVTILDQQGEEVFARELDPQMKGRNIFTWDGLQDNGTYAKSGAYSLRVDAENEKGAPIPIQTVVQDRIVGVSFEGGETNFLVGDSKAPQKVAFKNVIRIEGDRASGAVQSPSSNVETDSSVPARNEAFSVEGILPKEFLQKMNPSSGAEETATVRASDESQISNAGPSQGFPNGLEENEG